MTERSGLLREALEAARMAVAAHDGQQRKGTGAPYAIHPLRVAERLAAHDLPVGADRRTVLLAALLHDTLEDTELPRARIVEAFGEAVASVVDEVTQDKRMPKAQRREKMIADCRGYSLEARLVKLADRWDNMTEMADLGPEFAARYCEEARRMLAAMRGTWPPGEQAIAELIEARE